MEWLLAPWLLWYTWRNWRAAPPHRRRVQGWFVVLAALWVSVLLIWILLPLLASWLGEAALAR